MKRILHIFLYFIIALSTIIFLSGCRSGNNEHLEPITINGSNVLPIDIIDYEDYTEYVYVSSFSQIPIVTNANPFSSYTIDNYKVYIASSVKTGDGPFPPHTVIYTPVIHSMNHDGTDYSKHINYNSIFPIGADTGFIEVVAMATDVAGYLWVYEVGYFSVLNLPDNFNDDEHEIFYEYYEEYDFQTIIKKLDHTGTEILNIDIKTIYGHISVFDEVSMETDKNNYLYVLIHSTDESNVYVFNENGDLQFDLLNLIRYSHLINTSSDTVAIAEYCDDDWIWSISEIDLNTLDFGEQISLPAGTMDVFSGENDNSVLISDRINLYEFNLYLGEASKLLDLNDTGMLSGSLKHVRVLSGGRIAAIEHAFNSATLLPSSSELIVFTRTPRSEVQEPITLTLATFQTSHALHNAVVQFNKRNNEYRIQIIDYVEHATHDDWYAGLNKLSLDIISGNAPDILGVIDLPVRHYVNKGLLVDLYSLIDADPDFDRSDIVQGALRASEINGGFYFAFPAFSITTILGDPSVLGSQMSWDIDELVEVLNTNPLAESPMGSMTTGQYFIYYSLLLDMDNYVDWETGNVYFDTDEFFQLLEFADTLPKTIQYTANDWELIDLGQQIMQISVNIGTLNDIQISRVLFGGDIVFKGLPVINGNGNMMNIENGLAILTTSESITGAWEFVRSIYMDRWQQENVRHLFPTNQSVFNERLGFAMESLTRPHIAQWNNFTVEYFETTANEAEQFLLLIDSMTSSFSTDPVIMNIILETALDYFNGRHTSQDAIRIIQNRVMIYVSEQTG